jgi:hypothetical protein
MFDWLTMTSASAGSRGASPARSGLAATLACAAALLVVPGVAVCGPRTKQKLTGDSTLAEWKAASTDARSEISVAIARKRLGADAAKLDVAKAAMEITGCVSATARDPRFEAWKVEPTAATCLDAPEKPAPAKD